MRLAWVAWLVLIAGGCEGGDVEGAVVPLEPAEGPIGAGELAVAEAMAADAPRAPPAAADTREVECDGIDQDGDGADLCNPDEDGDGVRPALDCDDSRAEISPLEVELRCDGIDQNCDGMDDCDTDGDGFLDRDDCAPRDPAIRDECRPRVEPPELH